MRSNLSNNPLVSYCLPVLNEEFFLPIYLENIVKSPFKNGLELVITDGGSTDNTQNIIEEFIYKYYKHINIDYKVSPQEGKAYTNDWKENEVRNDLLKRCKGDYIALIDADEIADPTDIMCTINNMIINNSTLASMKFVPFWGDLHHVRLSVQTDYRWYGIPIGRVIKNGHWNYNDKEHHCVIQSITDNNKQIQVEYPLYHLHYGFGKDGIKSGDNRRADLLDPKDNISMYKVPDIVENPDFSDKCWTTDVGWILHVLTQEYEGPWPEVLEKYL